MIDEPTPKRLITLSEPHRGAIHGTLKADFPQPFLGKLNALVLALNLDDLMHAARGDTGRKRVIEFVNTILAEIEHSATPVDPPRKGDAALTTTVFDNLNNIIAGDELLDRIDALSNSHMHAIFDAVKAAFPDNNPCWMCTAEVALDLRFLLCTISSIDRPHAVNTFNTVLVKSGYRLGSDDALERILEQRDLELYEQGGLTITILNLFVEPGAKLNGKMIAGRLFPDLQASERTALGAIINEGLTAWRE
jgi:hypothetical protein